MTDQNQPAKGGFDAEAFLDANAPAVGLAIDPAHRPGVIANLQRLHGLAAQLMTSPLPMALEPAPVFDPGVDALEFDDGEEGR